MLMLIYEFWGSYLSFVGNKIRVAFFMKRY